MGGLVCLPGSADAGTRAGAPGAGLAHLDDHFIGRDTISDDDSRALRCFYLRAELRRMPFEIDIQGVLILQAAHQPPARACDPHGVDGEVLVLRHPDRDRLEVLQERGAAQIAAAWADPALQLRLVPGPDLPELDLRA